MAHDLYSYHACEYSWSKYKYWAFEYVSLLPSMSKSASTWNLYWSMSTEYYNSATNDGGDPHFQCDWPLALFIHIIKFRQFGFHQVCNSNLHSHIFVLMIGVGGAILRVNAPFIYSSMAQPTVFFMLQVSKVICFPMGSNWCGAGGFWLNFNGWFVSWTCNI